MIKKKLNLTLIGILLVLSSCEKDPRAKIEECIYEFNAFELGTVEYTVEKAVKAEDSSFSRHFGDKKMIYSMEAIITAGIDMADFDPDESIKVKDRSVKITFPKPKILSINIPQESIKCEFSKVGTFRQNFDENERNAIQKEGEEAIKNNISELSIIKDAETNAKTYFESTLKVLGFESIQIRFKN